MGSKRKKPLPETAFPIFFSRCRGGVVLCLVNRGRRRRGGDVSVRAMTRAFKASAYTKVETDNSIAWLLGTWNGNGALGRAVDGVRGS